MTRPIRRPRHRYYETRKERARYGIPGYLVPQWFGEMVADARLTRSGRAAPGPRAEYIPPESWADMLRRASQVMAREAAATIDRLFTASLIGPEQPRSSPWHPAPTYGQTRIAYPRPDPDVADEVIAAQRRSNDIRLFRAFGIPPQSGHPWPGRCGLGAHRLVSRLSRQRPDGRGRNR